MYARDRPMLGRRLRSRLHYHILWRGEHLTASISVFFCQGLAPTNKTIRGSGGRSYQITGNKVHNRTIFRRDARLMAGGGCTRDKKNYMNIHNFFRNSLCANFFDLMRLIYYLREKSRKPYLFYFSLEWKFTGCHL